MADRPARPGKHAARHRGPSATQRLVSRVTPSLPSVRHPRLVAVAATSLAASAVVGTQLVGGGPERVAADDRAVQSALNARASSVAQGVVSRDADRAASLDQLKAQAMATERAGIGRHRGEASVETAEVDYADMDPREIAQDMLIDYGWSEEFYCLDELYIGESNWDPYAENPTSGAYGIPQSLPAEKMASAGSDWRTNPATQIEWGLAYIESSYGSPCAANEFKNANGWY